VAVAALHNGIQPSERISCALDVVASKTVITGDVQACLLSYHIRKHVHWTSGSSDLIPCQLERPWILIFALLTC
jgi:hypothetical protein